MTNKQRARQWRSFRRRAFFTQQQLADALGVSRLTVNEIENAYDRQPRASILARFEALKAKHTKVKTDSWKEPLC